MADILITVGSSTGDFDTFQQAIDSVADDPTDNYEFRAVDAEDFGAVNMNITNANNVTFLISATDAVSGAHTDPSANSSKARISSIVVSQGKNVTIEKLRIAFSGSNGVQFDKPNCTVRRCMILGPGTGSGTGVEQNDTAGVCYVHNNVILRCNYGVLGQTSSETDVRENSFLVDPDGSSALLALFATIHANGNICQNVGSQVNYRNVSGTLDGNYNVAQDTSAPGGNSWQSQSGVYESGTDGSEDLDLAAGSQGDYDVATPFASWVVTYPDLATDILGTTRTGVIDAGAWQTPVTAVPPDLTYGDEDLTELTSAGTITPTNGGDPPTSCSVDGGGDPLPTGLTLNNDGTITGTPADGSHGSYDVLINNSNAGGSGPQASIHIDVTAAIPVISYTTPQDKPTGSAATITPTNTGSSATWSITSGTLPTGLSINSGSGVISGTPTTKTLPAGVAVTVSATNGGGTDTFDLTIKVHDLYTATVHAENSAGSDETDVSFKVYAGTTSSGDPSNTSVIRSNPIVGSAFQSRAFQ